ncbi:MAG: DUF2927 domain-containing protein, partial [Actinomycetota bacterium]
LVANGTVEETDLVAVRIRQRESFSPCSFFPVIDPDQPGVIEFVLVLLKDETRGALRESCYHEEFAQFMGLMNDDDRVRPSIFNDDEEFAFLTEHDTWLLRMLYDDRLRPGMTAEEVRPLLRPIIDRLRPVGREQS